MRKMKLVRISDRGDERSLATVLGCKVTTLPIKYLSLLLGVKFKDVKTWKPIMDLFEKRLARWKKNFLSKGGILTLIKSTLSNLPIYQLSILTIPASIAAKPENI